MRLFSTLLALSLIGTACRKGELTDQEACDKIAALMGTESNAAEKDRCLASYGAGGPNLRKCHDACIRASTNLADFTDCSDDCTGGPSIPSFIVCEKKTTEGQAFDSCVKSHDALKTSAPATSKCWLRCGRRAKTAAEVDACDVSCKVPLAP